MVGAIEEGPDMEWWVELERGMVGGIVEGPDMEWWVTSEPRNQS